MIKEKLRAGNVCAAGELLTQYVPGRRDACRVLLLKNDGTAHRLHFSEICGTIK
jgi:hypothetical protein